MKSFSLCVFLYLSTVALLSRSNEVPTLVISENELKEEINKENQYETQIIDTIVSIDSSADFVDNNTLEVVGDTSATTIPLPHIFVLNLDRATERWENIQKVMNAADLSIERLPGVDGRRLSPQELTKHSSFLARTFQPRGVVGCYISHRKFWQMIVDRNLDSAILFEDDVQLVPDFKQLLQTRLLQLKEDKLTYDVIFLGAIGMVHPQKRDSFFSRLFALYMGGCRKFCKVNDYLYQPTKPAGTHAYMVSNEGARKLLALCSRATFHVDLDAFRHHNLKLYMFDPMMAYQTFDSTSLTELPRGRGILGRIKSSRAYKTLDRWATDKYTKQTMSHTLEEPLLQLTQHGPTLTVERHLLLVAVTTLAACVSEVLGHHDVARWLMTGLAMFTVGVRSMISMIMRLKW